MAVPAVDASLDPVETAHFNTSITRTNYDMRRMYVCMSEIGNNHEEVTVTGFF